MDVAQAISTIRGKAAELQAAGAGGNEANTKTLLIEPMLGALGWDTTDIAQVDREFRVYDGTKLDYALKVEKDPRLFVEAKAVGRSLDDKQFIAQAINYANNEGVLWCVLTNGIAYRVYKTNEPVGMQDKLLFEVDLEEKDTEDVESAQSLSLIGREALIEGHLDLWGERVFTDTRVRHALGTLASKPPKAFLTAIEDALGKPPVGADLLKESIRRVLDVDQALGQGPKPPAKPKSAGPAPKPKPGGGGAKEYSIQHHLGGYPAAIVDFFEQLDAFARGRGPDVTRRVRKQYLGYFAGDKGKSFCTVETQRRRLLVYLNLDPTAVSPWDASSMRDVREVGHFGMGDVEFSVRHAKDLDGAKTLIQAAYQQIAAS